MALVEALQKKLMSYTLQDLVHEDILNIQYIAYVVNAPRLTGPIWATNFTWVPEMS